MIDVENDVLSSDPRPLQSERRGVLELLAVPVLRRSFQMRLLLSADRASNDLRLLDPSGRVISQTCLDFVTRLLKDDMIKR